MILADIELPVLIVYILMVVGFIVMLWGIKNQNTKASARIVMIIGAVIVFGAFAASFTVSGTKTQDTRVELNAKTFLSAKAEKAADYIANRFPEEGSAAFLIDATSYGDSNSIPYFLLEDIQKRLQEKGISCGDILVVGRPKTVVDKKTGEESIVNDDPTDAAIMKKTLDPYIDNVDVVVNFVGLPDSLADLRKITFLTRKNTTTGKNNMILFSDNGLPYVEQAMLKSGRVSAIIDEPNAEGNEFNMRKDTAPKDLLAAFDLMYFFINENTVDSFIAENPTYFITK